MMVGQQAMLVEDLRICRIQAEDRSGVEGAAVLYGSVGELEDKMRSKIIKLQPTDIDYKPHFQSR